MEIAWIDGISLRMFPDDHGLAHFHAVHPNSEAAVHIPTLQILEGSLRPAHRKQVVAWARPRLDLLRESWRRCRRGENPLPIGPFR